MFWFLWLFSWAALWMTGAVYAWQVTQIAMASGGKGLGFAMYIFAFTPIYMMVFALLTGIAWLIRWSMGLQKTDPKYRAQA